MDDVSFVCELKEVPDLRARFMATLEGDGIDGDELHMWALAFTELVNNALEHGCRAPGDTVSVRWWGDRDHVGVSVVETEEGSVTQADFDDASCDAFAETGRGAGLFLIRAWVDDVKVLPAEPGGTEIRVVRHRETANSSGGER